MDKELLKEKIKGMQFMQMSNEIDKLKERDPDYLKAFYDCEKLMQLSLSETEITSKLEYEYSRLDTKLWNMIEKERKKASKIKLLKKTKGIDEI